MQQSLGRGLARQAQHSFRLNTDLACQGGCADRAQRRTPVTNGVFLSAPFLESIMPKSQRLAKLHLRKFAAEPAHSFVRATILCLSVEIYSRHPIIFAWVLLYRTQKRNFQKRGLHSALFCATVSIDAGFKKPPNKRGSRNGRDGCALVALTTGLLAKRYHRIAKPRICASCLHARGSEKWPTRRMKTSKSKMRMVSPGSISTARRSVTP